MDAHGNATAALLMRWTRLSEWTRQMRNVGARVSISQLARPFIDSLRVSGTAGAWLDYTQHLVAGAAPVTDPSLAERCNVARRLRRRRNDANKLSRLSKQRFRRAGPHGDLEEKLSVTACLSLRLTSLRFLLTHQRNGQPLRRHNDWHFLCEPIIGRNDATSSWLPEKSVPLKLKYKVASVSNRCNSFYPSVLGRKTTDGASKVGVTKKSPVLKKVPAFQARDTRSCSNVFCLYNRSIAQITGTLWMVGKH